MDEGGGLHNAAGDSTASEAVPTLQAWTAGHRQLALRVTAKMTGAALPAWVAYAKQHPYILWASDTTASSDTTICRYFGETHHGRCLQRLIMPNFSSLLGVQKCTSALAFSLLSSTLPDATLNLIYFTYFWSKHFLFKQYEVEGIFSKEYRGKEIVLN